MVSFSILIPVYNGIEFLEECVLSVIGQTFTDWEIFIGINGHGQDGGNVANIANKIAEKDSRIHVIVQPPPLNGKVESLNNLVLYAKADWVCILDCDDKWDSHKLEYQYEAITQSAKNASVIGTLCRYFGEKNFVLSLPTGFIEFDIFENYNPIINSSVAIRRELCKWEYNEINTGMDDYWLWTQLALANHLFYNIDKVLVFHRIHSRSAFNSKNQDNTDIRTRYKNLRKLKADNK